MSPFNEHIYSAISTTMLLNPISGDTQQKPLSVGFWMVDVVSKIVGG